MSSGANTDVKHAYRTLMAFIEIDYLSIPFVLTP